MVITNPAIESEAEEPPPVVERVDVTTENALQQAASGTIRRYDKDVFFREHLFRALSLSVKLKF